MVGSGNPWKKYRVGRPSNRRNWTEPSCSPCSEVSHVSHIDVALRIVEDGKIRQGLVFDESVLNVRRILVCWLSPNSWSNGFRYGNIRFNYDFESLVEGKRYYWVEAITAYTPVACRILVTTEDRSTELQEYDPTVGDGPWWHDSSTGKHYINGNYCLEFMVEGDLSLRKSRSVDFVKHHPDWCSIHRTSPKLCNDLGMHDGHGGARFLMRAASRGIDLSPLKKLLIEDEHGALTYRVKEAVGWATTKLLNLNYSSQIAASSDTGLAVARAVLNALAIGRVVEAQLLASLFRSESTLMKALSTVIGESLGFEDVSEIRKAME